MFGLASALIAVPAGAEPQRAAARMSSTPIIVELFTSEGCSDCPPADQLLAELSRTQPVGGAEIIALEEHVDYWNHGGWSDPFSSTALTSRQSAYADRAGSDEVYTPELVINGGAQFVGGDKQTALREIKHAALAPTAQVKISALESDTGSTSFQVDLSYPAARPNAPGVTVLAAVTEDGLISHVGGGENGGRVLHHSAVVRVLSTVGVVTGRNGSVQVRMPLASGWHRDRLHVVAFAQARDTGRILGASEVSL